MVKMDIKSVKKVVRVHVEVQTSLGEFRLFDDGLVCFWDDYASVWRDQSWILYNWSEGEDVIAAIREAGMKLFLFNKGV